MRYQPPAAEKDSGKLCTLIKQDVTLSLMPPDVEELQEAA